MLVVYRKSDKKVLSTSPGRREGNKKGALEEVAKGLEGSPSSDDLEIVEVDDPSSIFSLSEGVARGRVTVEPTKEGGFTLVDAAPEVTTILITTDAKEFHPVDGVPLIPGDGQSFLTVTLQKVKEEGSAPLKRVTKDNEVIWLRTDHGSLREDKDPGQVIRSVKLTSGTARFRIYSENAKRLASVQMLSENPGLRLGGVRVEFI